MGDETVNLSLFHALFNALFNAASGEVWGDVWETSRAIKRAGGLAVEESFRKDEEYHPALRDFLRGLDV